MSGSLDLSSNEMPKASASPSGSTGDSDEVIAQKRAIIEMSNTSVLKGYDMAMDILTMNGMTAAVDALIKYRGMVELGLQKSLEGRY